MSTLYYICECGCINTKEQLVRISCGTTDKSQYVSKIEVCAEHRTSGKIQYRKTECVRCKQYFDTERAAGRVPERCSACDELHRKELKNNAAMRYRNRKREMIKKKKERENRPRTFCSEVCGDFCAKQEAPWEVNCGVNRG